MESFLKSYPKSVDWRIYLKPLESPSLKSKDILFKIAKKKTSKTVTNASLIKNMTWPED